MTISQTADVAQNYTLTDRLWQDNKYKYPVSALGYGYDQDFSPYGSAVAPYSEPPAWDSIPAESGNQPLYVEAPNGQVRAGSPYACKNGGCDGKRTCVGGKNPGADCTSQGVKVCQGGVCVGSDKAVNNAGVDAAIASIQELFAKSMGIWNFSITESGKVYRCNGGPRDGSECNHLVDDKYCGIYDLECSGTNYACEGGDKPGESCDRNPNGGCEGLYSQCRLDLNQCCDPTSPDICISPVSDYCGPDYDCQGKTTSGICETNVCKEGTHKGETCDDSYGGEGCGVGNYNCEEFIETVSGYSDGPGSWDITYDLAGTKTKIQTTPPQVSGLKVSPTQGSKSLPVKLNFYAWADDNHMPLKKIRIDWPRTKLKDV